MYHLVKLGIFAALDAAIVGWLAAAAAILAGWPVEWALVPAMAVMSIKLIEFAVVWVVFDVRGKAYDRAMARFYSALSARDLKTAKSCLWALEQTVTPLYSAMGHIMNWNAVDYDRMASKRLAMVDEARSARRHFESVKYYEWR